jgi:hypothetical protein
MTQVHAFFSHVLCPIYVPLAVLLTGGHVEYVSPHFFVAVTLTLYLLSTSVSLLLSTHRVVKAFGGAALLSFGAAYRR